MKKMSIALFAFLVVSVFTSGFRTALGSTTGVTWVKYPGNPLNLGTSLTWPWVVYDGQMFKMWYTNLTEQSDAQNICFADSSDGIDWTRHGMVLDKGEAGSWDNGAIMGTVILYDGTTYKMWYLGMELVRACSVGYATSSDGIHWSKYSGNPVMTSGGNGGWDDWHIAQISIIFNGTHYIMWYGAQAVPDCNVAMGVAISVDGVSWTKYPGNPVLVGGPGGWDSAHIFPGPVIGSGGQYEMWYYGQPRDLPGGIGLATSPDGFSWSKYGGNPVLESGPAGAWDSTTVHHPCVLERDGDLLMWYSGLDSAGSQRIGLATSYSLSVPSVPRDLNAMSKLSNIELHWTDPSDTGGLPIRSYRIYRGVTSGGETFLASVEGNVHSYIDTSASTSLCFYYVTAVNSAGEGPPSNEVKCSCEQSFLGIETVVNLESFTTKRSLSNLLGIFTVQQNFEIAVGGSLIHRFWAQNVIEVWPNPVSTSYSLMLAVFEIWESNDGGVTWSPNPTVAQWQTISRPYRLQNLLILRSTIEGDKLIMRNNCKEYNYSLALNSYILGLHSQRQPEIVIMGPPSIPHMPPGTVVFKEPTKGHVDTYTRIGSDTGTWLQCENFLAVLPHTGERSKNLKWSTSGDFQYQDGASDQGLFFWPDYDSSIVSPP